MPARDLVSESSTSDEEKQAHLQPFEGQTHDLGPVLAEKKSRASARVAGRERHEGAAVSNASEPGGKEAADVLDLIERPDGLEALRTELGGQAKNGLGEFTAAVERQ